MPGPRVTPNGIHWNGEEIPWLSAEFHYWRNRREDWPLILRRIKEAGFPIVTSFVQWNVHEYVPGKCDFEGRTTPERSLPAFLELCGREGLYAHLRPGPACCEWRNSGGTSFGTPWKKIYDEFWKVVAPFQVTKGGPLLALQIQNEWFDPVGFYYVFRPIVDTFDGFTTPPEHQWVALATNNFHYISAGYEFRLDELTEYLRWKYKTPAELGKAWGIKCREFADAVSILRDAGVETFHGVHEYLRRQYRDAKFPGTRTRPLFDIMNWMIQYPATQLRRDVDHARRKTSLLVTHNWPSKSEAEYNDLAGLDLSGYDCYAKVDVDTWDWIYVSHDFQANRYPFSGEFETGLINPYMWGGLGFYDEPFSRWNILSFFGSGLRGINLYMFVERDNWCHCPLDERGGRRPTYESVSGVIKGLQEVEWHRRRLARDIAVVKHLPYHMMATDCFDSFPDRGFKYPWLGQNLYAGHDPKKDCYELFCRLHDRNIDFQTVKVEEGEFDPAALEPDTPDVIVAYSLWFMHKPLAKSLRSFAEAGGKLVLGPQVPEADLECRRMQVFKDLPKASKSRVAATELIGGEGRRIRCPKDFETFTFPARKTYTHTVKTNGGKVCAYAIPLGDGVVVVTGFPLSRVPAFLEEVLLNWLGAVRYASTGVEKADAGLGIMKNREPVAIVYNGNPKKPVRTLRLSASAFEAGAAYHATDLLAGRDLGRVTVPKRGRTVRLALEVPPRDATIIRFSREETAAPPELDAITHATFEPGDWRCREEGFDRYVAKYAGPEPAGEWITVPGDEWTLPAIASGKTFGVQGWFWFRREVELPQGNGPVLLRIAPAGYHNLVEAYVNGRPVGVAMAERPGGESRFDVTDKVLPGSKAVIALRVLRQTLDCHDRGVSGFREVVLECGSERVRIDEWKLQQECLFAGEEEGWANLNIRPEGWSESGMPIRAVLRRNRDIVWLRSEFRGDVAFGDVAFGDRASGDRASGDRASGDRAADAAASGSPASGGPASGGRGPAPGWLRIEGRDAQVWVYVNGTYLAKTPYLPVDLPIDGNFNPDTNSIVLRVMADPNDLYTTAGKDRYRAFIQEAHDPCELRIDRVELRLGG